jgi:hypothetical protein
MQNITELRKSLADNYEKLKANEMPIKLGKELANTAGKILNSISIELEACKMLEIKPDIDFLK